MDGAEEISWTYGEQYPYLLAQSEYQAVDFYIDRGEIDLAEKITTRLKQRTTDILKDSEYAVALYLILKAKVAEAKHMVAPDRTTLSEAAELLKAIKVLERVDVRQFRIRGLLVLARVYLRGAGNVDDAVTTLREAKSSCERAHDKLHGYEVELGLIRARSVRITVADCEPTEMDLRRLIAEINQSVICRSLPDLYLTWADLCIKANRTKDAAEMLAQARHFCERLQRRTLDIEIARVEQSLGAVRAAATVLS